jgi:Na+-driven multidrug efflux pump
MVTGSGFIVMDFMIGVLDGVICKIGLCLLFVKVLKMGYVGYFWGVDASRILPGILCFLYFMSGKWRNRKLLGKRGK